MIELKYKLHHEPKTPTSPTKKPPAKKQEAQYFNPLYSKSLPQTVLYRCFQLWQACFL